MHQMIGVRVGIRMPKPTIENLDREQLELMWSFLKFGNGKPNIAALKENLDALRQIMIQKSAGQEPYRKPCEIPFGDIGTIVNNIAIEAMQLYLSGGLDELDTAMNNEYIKRKAVNDILNELGGCDASDEWGKGWDKAIDTAIEAVRQLPVANVTPIKHGHIVLKERCQGGFKSTKCSNCTYKNALCRIPYCSECGKLLGTFQNYCGNCGAKMDIDK